MRRLVAVLTAFVLMAAMASSSIAAAPASSNRFVGEFDMLDWDLTTVVGHVSANIVQASDSRLVPGTVDIDWATDGPIDVRESHAQLITSEFLEATWDDPYSPTGSFHALEVLVTGYICDYRGRWDASCGPFAMMFQQITNTDFRLTANKVGFSQPGTTVCCDGPWWPASTKGAWAMTWLAPTFP